ncbi:MAG TPA: hypothetical protein DEG43_12545 [Acidimicrobiaceae bacterium]|jgi:hypothetical protein|nr:hypothetical protein [Acidimicrobiaceae bacterium]
MKAAESLFLGKDLLPWLLLAVGAALAVANLAAVLRPPLIDPQSPTSARREPPPWRKVALPICIGLAISIWAIASLLK